MHKQKFIEKLLFDYDLIDLSRDNGHRIESALLDATLYEQQKDEPRKLIVKHL